MEYLLIRGIVIDWDSIAKKVAFQLRELRVKNYIKAHTGKRISLDSIPDSDLRQDVKQYLLDIRNYAEKKVKESQN